MPYILHTLALPLTSLLGSDNRKEEGLKNEEGEIMQLNDRPFGELVLYKMVFSWFSAPFTTLIAGLLWAVAVMAFSVDTVFAVWCAGFAAVMTIAALDMWWTYYLKKKSFAGKILRSIGL